MFKIPQAKIFPHSAKINLPTFFCRVSAALSVAGGLILAGQGDVQLTACGESSHRGAISHFSLSGLDATVKPSGVLNSR